jgi:DNA repair photolyase
MLDAPLFPGLATPDARRRCAPRHEPAPRPVADRLLADRLPADRPPADHRRTSHVIDHLRFVDGRRVLTTNVGLRPEEIAELARAARFGRIEVRYRIPTPDRRLADVLDPRAPSPYLRFASLRAARRAGLAAGVVVAPLIPGVNANEADLRRLFADARRAGAAFVDVEVSSPTERRRAELIAELRRRYPRVAARHEVWRRASSLSPHDERARIEALVEELGRAFGLPRKSDGRLGPPGSGRQSSFSFAG